MLPLALVANGAVQTNVVPFAASQLGTPAVHDGYLYLPADSLLDGGLAVFDLANPEEPAFAAGVRTAGPASDAPAFLGDTAYVPTEAGIEVFDMTRPEEPAHVRLLTPHAPRSSVADLNVVGERLVARQWEAIRLYDLSDPFSPFLTDAAPMDARGAKPASALFLAATPLMPDEECPGNFGLGKGYATNHLFRIDSGRFVDYGPLALPENYVTNAPALHFVTDKIAYLADGPDAILIADFTDPRRPDIAGCTNVPSDFLPPQRQRGRLFAGSTNVLEVINVWKPLEPRHSRTVVFPPHVDVTRLSLAGDYAYFPHDTFLQTFSIAGSNAVLTAESRFKRQTGPTLLAGKSPLERAVSRAPGVALIPDTSYNEVFREDLVIIGGRIARSHGLPNSRPTGIALFEPSNHLAQTSAVHTLGGTVHGFCADPASNRLFAADSLSIVVFRVTDGDLTEEARFPLSRHPLYGPRALALANDGTNQVLLAACGADGLRAYAYDGTNLNLRGTCETGGFACDVAVSGDRVFVADRERGVTVCRYAGGQLEKIRTHALPRGTATAIAAKNGMAYVAAGDVPLAILSDTPPISLATRKGGPAGAYALDIALLERGDRLFALIADGRAGLSLYDVTNPKAPVFASLLTADEDTYTFFNSVSAVCTDGRLAYALDTCDGFLFGIAPFPEDDSAQP